MKKLSSFLLLAVAICAAATTPRVSRNALKAVETNLTERVKSLWEDNPFSVIGNTRGLYLEDYGAVFTMDVSPVLSTTSMMHPTVTKEEVIKARKVRMERIAQLKQVMRMAVADAAASLDSVPGSDRVTVVVYLAHHEWEDISGMPGQLTFRGTKFAMLDARRGGGPAAAAQAVQVSEN